MEGTVVFILGTTTLVLAVLLVLIFNKWLKAVNEINRKETVIIREKSHRKEFGIQYFSDQSYNSGLFSSKNEIRYMMQLMVDNLPIGTPSEFSRDTVRKVDKEQVNKTLDDFAKPLIDAGIQVAVKKLSI